MGMRGFSALEAVLSITLFLVVLAGATMGLASKDRSHRALAGQLGPQARAEEALDRIRTDLRQASFLGEDRNGDGLLNAGEDVNGNGLLESAWRVGEDGEQGLDAGEPRSSLRFNRRIEDMDEAGNLVAPGIFSAAIRYFQADGAIVREWEQDGETVQATLAEGITDLRFRFDPATKLVTVEVDVATPTTEDAGAILTLTARVWLRN